MKIFHLYNSARCLLLAGCMSLATVTAQPLLLGGDGDGYGTQRFLGTLNGEAILGLYQGGISDGDDQQMTGGTLNGISSVGHYSSGAGDGFGDDRFLGTLQGNEILDMFRGGSDDGFDIRQSTLVSLQGAAFPVVLLSFDAIPKQDYVLLEWVTASELNHHFFTIERSEDARDFQDLIHTDGAGTSFTRRTYVEKDLQPLPGTSFYRLRTNDFDGSFSHSQIVEVNREIPAEWNMRLYPNPNKGDRFNISLSGLPEGIPFQVEMVDMKGAVTYRRQIVPDQILISWEIPLPDGVPDGSYLVRVSSDLGQISKILVILR